MNTARKIEILENIHEALNGLTMGWQVANVKDDAKRAELQAPIIAGQEAMMNALRLIDEMAREDGDHRQVSLAVYGHDAQRLSCLMIAELALTAAYPRPDSIAEAIAA